ncbi:glycosyltransferase family 39 protein [Candidatus Riflebacteria bacterium]
MDKLSNFTAFLLLLVMFLLMLGSTLGDSLTTDEIVHVHAGYNYLKKKSVPLNPGHPPLIMSLAGIPLQFLQIKGGNPIAHDNDLDRVVLFSRLPCMFIALLCGVCLYIWVAKICNRGTALMALILFAFEPTILAHSQLVTTDMGVTTFIFIAVYSFSRLLCKYDTKHYFLFIFSSSGAILTKYSAMILLPYLSIIWICHLLWHRFFSGENRTSDFKFGFRKITLALLTIFFISVSLYLVLMWNYPLKKQLDEIRAFTIYPIYKKEILLEFLQYPFARYPGNYLFGMLTTLGHVTQGHLHTQYLMGEYSHSGWWYYFIVAFMVKTPVSFILFLSVALGFFMKKQLWDTLYGLKSHFKFPEEQRFVSISLINSIIFILLFGLISLKSRLNIGIRHILPIYPFLILFTCYNLFRFLQLIKGWQYKIYIMSLIIAILFYGYGTIMNYPHYLSYFNEFIGPANGFHFLSDSNLDWGQDLKRLAIWVKENGIKKIKIDYWGGASVRYYLGKNFRSWSSHKGIPKTGYFAVSIFYILLNNYYYKIGKIPHSYDALLKKKPFTRIGYSIYVYKMD